MQRTDWLLARSALVLTTGVVFLAVVSGRAWETALGVCVALGGFVLVFAVAPRMSAKGRMK